MRRIHQRSIGVITIVQESGYVNYHIARTSKKLFFGIHSIVQRRTPYDDLDNIMNIYGSVTELFDVFTKKHFIKQYETL